jgi:cytosine/adenosine deaminase-related metal-dependent hydrolase
MEVLILRTMRLAEDYDVGVHIHVTEEKGAVEFARATAVQRS